MNLNGKRIILGVSGSIAAYKAVILLRLLQKAGAEVKVVITPSTEQFVGSLTFSSLAGTPVFKGLWDENWSEHVDWGNWADLMVVAPATTNTLAKMAHGICDNALLAVYMAAKCPVMVAPAMDVDMFSHPRTQANLKVLEGDGRIVLDTGSGYHASGLLGKGRLLEPEEILEAVAAHFDALLPKPLAGKHVLITAGPTQEPLDPVRFLTNRSTGKMGYALAEQAAYMGATVTLVSGYTHLEEPRGVNRIVARTAEDMYQAVHAVAANQDLMIFSAAVADYTPATVADQKMKKGDGDLSIPLKRTHDILKSVGAIKREDQTLVGFALETQNEQANAEGKLKRKNLDLIVLNSLNDKGAGFGHDTNQVTIIDRNLKKTPLPLASKQEIAVGILQQAIAWMVGQESV
ncbi:bifunctional phosphopantothenoylcysteine decarboxylase/phosphopantothenate--cysteine ligase CoaBC [Pontibacter sp. G13]|uniref:bifunctional phosphopantothenoylcysteine decarboxylase/phosphopantothenate--cysteine ligase CoaBC n=1 Tax=Pontibacter sp. G13 TaxID=3074898 RepID=UPI00288AEFED|nr:bifunctional phosphopantothenoylcysteine decarboxylase/phosphopantothenate--cysteine ligase CoaBC [Pontibacter sp. G13]WNJ20825.1 bifunctional phosphopantothenoylcysteine decarboxylase/phosphopantothenate--cysteine ligase CoaBC [Pontibacter sp. G13]